MTYLSAQWGLEKMLVLDMDIRTDNDHEPVPMFMTQILTRKLTRWLRNQGIEANVAIDGHTARMCIMTDGWKEDDYDPFCERLREGIRQALRV